MAIVEERRYRPFLEEDPDDYRPSSEGAFVIDPTSQDGRYVRTISILFENLAPGDRIPLHTHALDEAVVVETGGLEAVLGTETNLLRPGTVVFIPAGTPHGWHNVSKEVARLHAVFPSDVIDIRYLERNPAPGTEGQAPQPPFNLNLRQLG